MLTWCKCQGWRRKTRFSCLHSLSSLFSKSAPKKKIIYLGLGSPDQQRDSFPADSASPPCRPSWFVRTWLQCWLHSLGRDRQERGWGWGTIRALAILPFRNSSPLSLSVGWWLRKPCSSSSLRSLTGTSSITSLFSFVFVTTQISNSW